MVGTGIWEVEVESDEAVQEGSRPNEEHPGIGIRLRFKTGEYVKDTDLDEVNSSKPVPNTND